jgi:hypothetical protein
MSENECPRCAERDAAEAEEAKAFRENIEIVAREFNPLLDDLVMTPAPDGHRTTINTPLPEVKWRKPTSRTNS